MAAIPSARSRGFTLIELAVAIVVVGILAAIAVPIYQSYIEDAKWSEANTMMGSLKTAVTAYETKYSDALDDIDISAGSSGTRTAWTALGVAAESWSFQHFSIENFGLTTNSDGSWLLTCDPSVGAAGPNPPSDPGSITVDHNNVWTRLGGAQ